MSRALRKEELPDRVIRKDAVLDTSGDPTIIYWARPNTVTNYQLMSGQIEKLLVEEYGPDRGWEIAYAINEGLKNSYEHRNQENPQPLSIDLRLWKNAVLAKLQGEAHNPYTGYVSAEERGFKSKDDLSWVLNDTNNENGWGTIYVTKFTDYLAKSLDGRVVLLGFNTKLPARAS
jgi:hypothetical protein